MSEDVVRFLIRVEESCAELYESAARRFRAFGDMSGFLSRLARDERNHVQLLTNAPSELVAELPLPFAFDEDDREAYLAPIIEARTCLEMGKLSTAALCQFIACLELGEWNDLFLYLARALRRRVPELRSEVDLLHEHLERVESFLLSRSEGQAALETMKSQALRLTTRILVVDDEESMLGFIEAVLRGAHHVTRARNGQEALEVLANGIRDPFDLIISDYNMQPVNGIEFFKRAVDFDASLRKRFLFLTGAASSDLIELCKEEDLPLLEKPLSVSRFREGIENRIRSLEEPPQSSSPM